MSDAAIRNRAREGRRTRAEVRLMSPRARGLLRLAAALGHEKASALVEPARCGLEWRNRLVYALPDQEVRLFSCDCADRALSLVRSPDPRSLRAIVVAREYALGKASKAELGPAEKAAEEAAEEASGEVAGFAARSAREASWLWDGYLESCSDSLANAVIGAAWEAAAAGEAVSVRAAAWEGGSRAAWEAEREWQARRIGEWAWAAAWRLAGE